MLPVRLTKGHPSEYKIRYHPDPEKIATIEAVGRALSLIEPNFNNENLLHPFRLMRDRLLKKSGKYKLHEMS